MRSILFLGLLALATPALAAPTTLTIPGTADLFLASQPAGTTIVGFFGSDTAAANAPIQYGVTAGTALSFTASGSTTVDGNCFAGPDGGCYTDESGFSPAPANGTYKGPANALYGVFLGSGTTDISTGPATLDYTVAANRSRASYAPALGTIFYIGDGLTGTGSGAAQRFLAPTGATELYLAAADSYGASFNNGGGLTVTVGPAAIATPEPAALALLGLGATGLVLLRRRARYPLTGEQEVRMSYPASS